jgi:hypothetical protein
VKPHLNLRIGKYFLANSRVVYLKYVSHAKGIIVARYSSACSEKSGRFLKIILSTDVSECHELLSTLIQLDINDHYILEVL